MFRMFSSANQHRFNKEAFAYLNNNDDGFLNASNQLGKITSSVAFNIFSHSRTCSATYWCSQIFVVGF